MAAPVHALWPELRLTLRGFDRALPGVVTLADSQPARRSPKPCCAPMTCWIGCSAGPIANA